MANVGTPPLVLDLDSRSRRAPSLRSWSSPAGTVAGETATFVGAGFTNITSVDFGGLPARFVVVDDGYMMAVIPNGVISSTMHMHWSGGVVTGPGGYGSPLAAFRLAFPIAYSTEVNGGTPTVYNRAIYVPSDVSAVTPKSRNALSTGGVGSSLTCNFAHYASDGSSGATGTAFPPGALLGQTVPGNGTDLSMGSHTITRGPDGKIVQCQSLAAGATCSCSVTPSVHGTYSAGTATVSPPPSVSGSDPTPICWNHFDILTTRPRVVFITDSIGQGVNTVIGFENSFPQQVAASKDYAVCALSLAGSTLQQWAAFGSTSAAWWADGIFGASVIVWVQLGVNDVGGRTGAQMYGDLTTIVNHLRNDLGVVNIYANTIAPNNSVNETSRTGYNGLLLANSLGLTGIGDFAQKQNVGGLADNGAGTSLFSSYDSGDHLHWADAGQNQAAAIVSGML